MDIYKKLHNNMDGIVNINSPAQ